MELPFIFAFPKRTLVWKVGSSDGYRIFSIIVLPVLTTYEDGRNRMDFIRHTVKKFP